MTGRMHPASPGRLPPPHADGLMLKRLGSAVVSADHARKTNGPAMVSIHVGTAVYEWLKSLAVLPQGMTPNGSLFFGHPIVHEPDWAPQHIRVRAETLIP